jgi:hypothetical protein
MDIDERKTFEAWLITDGRGERLDNHNPGTKETSPIIAIARRGNDLFFCLTAKSVCRKASLICHAPSRHALWFRLIRK